MTNLSDIFGLQTEETRDDAKVSRVALGSRHSRDPAACRSRRTVSARLIARERPGEETRAGRQSQAVRVRPRSHSAPAGWHTVGAADEVRPHELLRYRRLSDRPSERD